MPLLELLRIWEASDFSAEETIRRTGHPRSTVYAQLKEAGVPRLRDISDDGIFEVVERHGGDVTAAAHSLRVVPKALELRLRQAEQARRTT